MVQANLTEVLSDSVVKLTDTQAAIAEANSLLIPVEHFRRAIRIIEWIDPNHDAANRAEAMTVVLSGRVEAGMLMPLIRAIELRMQALVDLSDKPAFKAWSIEASADEPFWVEEVLLDIAASAPVIERDGRPAFEPESFFRTVLARGAVGGQG